MPFVTILLLIACSSRIASAVFSLSDVSTLWSDKALHDQIPLGVDPIVSARNYSVGFHLASSYGAAAVIVDGPDNERKDYAWVVYGNDDYTEVMARLSLASSRHLAPPYDDMQESFDDLPRVLARRALKKAGLPATPDVGSLATVIKELKEKVELELGVTVTDATVSAAHLTALYQDDIVDLCEYVGFKYVIPKRFFRPVLWEAGVTYAGHGFGLCKHWHDDTECAKEEKEFPDLPILVVHRSRIAFTSTLALITRATSTWDTDSRRVEDFALGSDAIDRYPSPEAYWTDVKSALLRRMIEMPGFKKPVKIIVTGDQIDGDFRYFLQETMEKFMGKPPPIYWDDGLTAPARGTAEFRRRGIAIYGP